MSDEQVVVLYRGLISVYETEEVQANLHAGVADGLLTQLEADLGGLTTRDPERVKNLVDSCMQSDKEPDYELALGVVSSLAAHDYAFTRDTLISLLETPGIVLDGAATKIPRLMRDRLSPDQVADFNAHLQARSHYPMHPAQPES